MDTKGKFRNATITTDRLMALTCFSNAGAGFLHKEQAKL